MTPGPPNLDVISDQKRSSFYTRFQTWPLDYFYYNSNKKDFLNSISNSHISFLSYSFGIETINTFIHFRSSLENHTSFQTKTAQKPYPYMVYIGESPPPPLGRKTRRPFGHKRAKIVIVDSSKSVKNYHFCAQSSHCFNIFERKGSAKDCMYY